LGYIEEQMKLYSRGQVIARAVFATVAAAGVTFAALQLLPLPGGVRGAPPQPVPAQGSDGLQRVQFQPQSQQASIERLSGDERNSVEIYHQLNEAVVNITSVTLEYNWFLDAIPRSGSGSGSIIDPAGHVLTNYHVVKDGQRLSITLFDGTEFPGTVVGVDQENDLAVIKFDPDGRELTTIPFGYSGDLLIGQKVLAIGNPFGLQRTLTTGVVSGLGRPVEGDDGRVLQSMIQTDASINPGNSGGPLLNSQGLMIGVNTVIYSPTGGSVGIGFAVPIDTGRRVVPELLQFGVVLRGWIDVVPIQLTPTLIRELRIPVDGGLLISEVAPDSPASKAGLRGGSQRVRWGTSAFNIGGDILVSVDNTTVRKYADLFAALEDNRPGDVVDVVVIRGRDQVQLSVQLSQRTTVRR